MMRPLTDNEKAAIIAAAAGILMLLSGVTGASQWRRTFEYLLSILGDSVVLRLVGLVFVALGSIGGIFVILGAYGFRNDKVRTGRMMIWLGSGFTIVSLVLYVILQVRHGDLPFAGAGVLGAAGIVLSVVARFRAKPVPLVR